MTLDTELLQTARTTRTTFDEADLQALLARADYHTAVRRLHLAGGSLREIAEALSLSHQRVQQIVSESGGSWWSRVWRSRKVNPDAVCTWCGRPPAEVPKLIAGPHVYVCDACVGAAEKTRKGRPAAPFRGVMKKSVTARCAFCAKRAGADRPLIAAPSGRICAECLRTCRDILDGRSPSPV